jgi:hypothetical protein
MTVNKRVGFGVTLGVDTSGSTTFTSLASIVTPPKGPGAKKEMADTAILSDKYKTYAPSQIDPGETHFTIAYDPDDATTTILTGLLGSVAATAANWKITYPSGSTGAGSTTNETFKAHLVEFERVIETNKLIVAEIKLKNTGDPGFTGD